MALDSTGMVPSPENTVMELTPPADRPGLDLLLYEHPNRTSGNLTILHFSTKLALLHILKQRLVALNFISRLTA